MKRIVVLFILVYPLFLLGQTVQTTTYAQDTTLFHNFNDSLKTLIYQDFDSANYYIDTMEFIANKADYQHGLYIVQNSKGIVFYMKG